MTKIFSKKGNSSKQPRKQRKLVYNLPLHKKGDLMNVHLSPELRKKYSLRNIRVRKGDKVKVVSGQHKPKSGKVEKVDLKNLKVEINGIEIIKKDGSKSFYKFHASNLMIVDLDTSDKKRLKQIKVDKPKSDKIIENKTISKESIEDKKTVTKSSDVKIKSTSDELKSENKVDVKKDSKINKDKNDVKEDKK